MSVPVDTDILIVGGGPIGLATAIEARLAGLSAVVVEPREGIIDKACGEGLMPAAVAALARLGVHPAGYAFHGISYQDAAIRADYRFRAGSGVGVRRTELCSALTARAAELGVQRTAGRVSALEQDADSVTAAGIRAAWLLGCDGLHSTVSRLTGLDAPVGGPRRFGLRRHFAVSPWSDLVEVHWTPRFELYVTPVADDLVGVAVLGPPYLDYARSVAAVPAVAERLGAPVTSLRGAGPMRRRTVRRADHRVLLVGDAAGYVDAITGEGIRVGLAQAKAAIEAIRSGAPEQYEIRWRRATRDARLITSGLLAWAGSGVRPAIVPAAVRLPRVFGAVVERIAG